MVNICPLYENPDDIYNNAPENEKGGKQAEAHLYRLLKEQLPDEPLANVQNFISYPCENGIPIL